MSRTYATITDLIMMELRPAIATDESLTAGEAEAVADKVCARMQDAGLIVWADGWSESLGAYWLPAQGFRLVEGDDDGEAFWAIVADVLSEQETGLDGVAAP